MSIKKRIKNFLESDASVNLFMVLAFVVTIAICIVGIYYENSKSSNGEKSSYSTTVNSRKHGGFGYGFGFNIRTGRYGFGFGTGGINFH